MSVEKHEGRPAGNGTASTRLESGHVLAPEDTAGGTALGGGAPLPIIDPYGPYGRPPCPDWCAGDRGDGFHVDWDCRSEWPCDCSLGGACVMTVTHAVDLGHGVEVSVSEYRQGDRHAWGDPVLFAERLQRDEGVFGSVDEAEDVLEHMESSRRAFAEARGLMARIEAETGTGRDQGGGGSA